MAFSSLKNVTVSSGSFVNSWINPWHVEEKHSPLKPEFFLEYRVYQVLHLGAKADAIENSLVKTIAQIGASSLDYIAAFFYIPIAFILNNTIVHLLNIVVYVQNTKIERNDLEENRKARRWIWIPKNPRFYALAISTVAAVGIYYGIKKDWNFSLSDIAKTMGITSSSTSESLSANWYEFWKRSPAPETSANASAHWYEFWKRSPAPETLTTPANVSLHLPKTTEEIQQELLKEQLRLVRQQQQYQQNLQLQQQLQPLRDLQQQSFLQQSFPRFPQLQQQSLLPPQMQQGFLLQH